jgi:hypothetical protein
MYTPAFTTDFRAPQRVAAAVCALLVGAAAQAELPTFVDAKSRANAQRELNVPPPGSARLQGLYATEDTDTQMGAGGNLSYGVKWRFYYFFANGHVYLGPQDAGLDGINCTQPTVNKYGDAVCTTYSADNDQIRIGNRNPTRLKRKGQDLQIGDYTFSPVPKASNLRLNGSYGNFSAGPSAASSSDIVFSRDGSFTSSRFVGLAVDTDPTNSGMTGGNRVSVSGNQSGNAAGTYQINGYTLVMTYSDGRQAKAFFARVAGEEVVRIGSRVFTRAGKR